MGEFLFTSESVTEGHPDKICDQVSDGVLDAVLGADRNARVACECLVNTGLVVVAGEISTETYVDIPRVARETLRRIGYDRAKYGFDADTCSVITAIDEQSPDIAQGVNVAYEARTDPNDEDEMDRIGAGDQGMMFGYATRETRALMPMPIQIAHTLAHRLSEVRKAEVIPYLRPDGKTQVTVRYENDRPVEIVKVLISTQHKPDIDGETLIKPDLWEHVVEPVLHEEYKELFTDKELYESFLVNPTGKFEIGGPQGDCGLTGRKVIVDTYGGAARHGGGCFSGKDPSKVDRSGAYAARHVAKNVVAAGLADRCEVQVAYAIGVAHPVSLMVETFGTGKLPDPELIRIVGEVFDLRPGAIVRDLDLRRPIFQKTAAYGHFGRTDHDFTWERTDRVEALRAAAGVKGARRPGRRHRRRLLAQRRGGLVAQAGGSRRGVRGAVHPFHHLVGIRDAGEDEVVVVARGGVEVHVAHLQHALNQRLVVVHVLHPLQPGLLDLAGDDPSLDVQAAGGDRVVGRDPLDEPSQDHDRHPDHRHQGHQPAVGPAAADPGDDRDREGRDQDQHKALDVEGDDRAPRGMPLEHHSLPGCQPRRHAASLVLTPCGVRRRA